MNLLVFAVVFPALYSMLEQIVPKLNEIICTDEDRQVAMLILEALNDMMKSIGQPVLQQPEHLDMLTATVKLVLQNKVQTDRWTEHLDMIK